MCTRLNPLGEVNCQLKLSLWNVVGSLKRSKFESRYLGSDQQQACFPQSLGVIRLSLAGPVTQAKKLNPCSVPLTNPFSQSQFSYDTDRGSSHLEPTSLKVWVLSDLHSTELELVSPKK